jgi:hypothetical protein
MLEIITEPPHIVGVLISLISYYKVASQGLASSLFFCHLLCQSVEGVSVF